MAEEAVNALRGNLTENCKLPVPRIVKTYIASHKHDFKEERRMLLEVVGPELQRLYDDRQIEIEFVDMHFGTGLNGALAELNPQYLEDHLSEIEICKRDSKSVFFIALLGQNLGNFNVPMHIDGDVFGILTKVSSPEEIEKLNSWYKCSNGSYSLVTEKYSTRDFKEISVECGKLQKLLESKFQEIIANQDAHVNEQICDKIKQFQVKALEHEINKALELSAEDIVAIFREWTNGNDGDNNDILPTHKQQNMRDETKIAHLKSILCKKLPASNHTTLSVEWNENGIDVDNEKHEQYLNEFRRTVFVMLQNAIDSSLSSDPDGGKQRKKTVQEIFNEHSTHLLFLNEHLASKDLIYSSIPEKLKLHVTQNFRANAKHSPYLIYGGHGSGKSSIISHIYSQVTSWFDHVKVHRIIRFASATPRSAYNLELLRVICQQMSIILNIPEGYLPKDASFDPLYINTWFQNIIKRCEDTHNNEIIFIFIDDLHKINPLDCDVVAALSWLPISLPYNVHIICSTGSPIDTLKLTPMQKERFKAPDYLFDLSATTDDTACKTVVRKAQENETFEQFVNRFFDAMEVEFGKVGFSRFTTYLTCAEYGLSETEFLELLMPINNSDAFLDTRAGDFNFSTFRTLRNRMRPLIREKLMSGKLFIQWRHSLCAETTRKRYMDQEMARQAHKEIVNLFFPQEESEESDESRTEEKSDKSAQHDGVSTNTAQQTSFGMDISYNIRHVEEAWHHLIQSDDTQKLKEIAVCNFDFLLAAVQTVSISYLRCLIEHVRCYILDRDIELVYYTIRKSSDVLTRDPMQLGAQIILWLRTVSDHEGENSLLGCTVKSAIACCDGYTVPLLVPLTGWLPVPLPSQIRCMTVTGTGVISSLEVSFDKQHLIVAPKIGDPQLWNIMKNSLVYTFKGHSAPITCMTVIKGTPYLLTGSEDTSVIIWDLKKLQMKHRIWDHIASVSCVTYGMNNSYIISGSDDSSIIISSVEATKCIHKIDHHRGPVVQVKVSQPSDVLVSASHDATVCLWSLENFTLLNLIQLVSPVIDIQISIDSVFLLVLCEDNGLYLRALTTGTELHALKGHKSKVRALCLAMDGQRAIAGCDDTRALIFDMHSGKLIRSLPPNPGPVTAVYVMEKDDYLITAGGNKITFYSFRNEDAITNFYPKKRKSIKSSHNVHSTALAKATQNFNTSPVACFDISRCAQMVAVAAGKTIQLWQINSPQITSTLEGHTGIITCINFSPNSEFIVSGSEDKSAAVWNVQMGVMQLLFKGHFTGVVCAVTMMDSRRIVSCDREGISHVWMADTGTILQTVQSLSKHLAVTNNMKYVVCSNGDNQAKIWSLTREDEKYIVSHSDEITCFVITADSLYVITGSKDMSLKVWQATGGKLTQVLVGHTDAVTCVAVSITQKSQVLSGSKDYNLILWDLHTGEEIHTLAGHLGPVSCVKVSADGTTAVSGSDDKTLIVWELKRGLALTSLQLHVPFTTFDISLEASRIIVQLVDSLSLPVICLLNTPANFIKLPTYSAPARDVEDLRPTGPKRPNRRLLKKEVSLDTYTWQKKYAHLTSSVMMAQVDERLKRRFSVSASMEEISKIAEMKTIESQQTVGPEQAALAQSQHFDQLEALWNKRSPPRRRVNPNLSRQGSVAEDRIDSSDEDEYMEERQGTWFHACHLPTHDYLQLPQLSTCQSHFSSLIDAAHPTSSSLFPSSCSLNNERTGTPTCCDANNKNRRLSTSSVGTLSAVNEGRRSTGLGTLLKCHVNKSKSNKRRERDRLSKSCVAQ
ncbi:protein qui-1 isoform X2 [Culicoides brevitarsis]|uniref:protein qui-1 isoform X2 n=1 Tax=Culicoides brevitarsis TaxID=469753 RepID=UPI00307C4606